MKDFSMLTNANKKIVLAFAENDMKVSKTARSTFYSKNTIDYHLKCVKQKTGLDPFKFYDLVEILTALENEGKEKFKKLWFSSYDALLSKTIDDLAKQCKDKLYEQFDLKKDGDT